MNISNPIENSGEFSSTHIYKDDNLEETLKQYYECMIAQVWLKWMQEGIKALEVELISDTRVSRIEIISLLIQEKWTASSRSID
jgi:hypothetical protein